MKMKNAIIFSTLLTVMVSGAAGAYDTPDTYSISKSFDLGMNFYNVYGSPDISANIIGSNEFDRGQTVTLNIDLVNNGKLLGFKNDRTPHDADEIFAARTEMKLESSVVDATGVVVSLSAGPESPIQVKSASQQVGSIRSGQNSLAPAKFDIKIDKKAKAGEYDLYLDLSYDYQKNVQIEDANASDQTYDVNHWYGMMAQNQTLKIKVKNQADFEIVSITGSLNPGKDNIIEIVIRNTGEEEARNVKAIANPSDPLSTTDDMAFLSTMAPGSTAVAKIKVKADSEAVPKVYGIDTVLKYDTLEGDTKYSDTLQVPVEVKEIGLFQRFFGWI
ncbi:COG1361 S-layer family protein [Methanomethylovorans sp.]|uniref:COG1361 S-layer family protein n=1 Tax=Methanomethylovorans sp. TaxID=2758717 RepID=UPI00351C3707